MTRKAEPREPVRELKEEETDEIAGGWFGWTPPAKPIIIKIKPGDVEPYLV